VSTVHLHVFINLFSLGTLENVPSPNWAEKLTAIAESIAAVGIVGALTVAFVVWRSDKNERQRSEVRKLRAWIELDEESIYNVDDDDMSGRNLRMVIENASDEFVYDIRSRLVAPVLVRDAGFFVSRGRLAPGDTLASTLGLTFEKERWWLHDSGDTTGVEVLFTDGRGVRWCRDNKGILRHVKPIRLWTPWRIPLGVQFELEGLPNWSPMAHWHFRREITEIRVREHWPIPWYAVDVMFRRRKYMKRDCPLPGHFWSLWPRWKSRSQISNRRLQNSFAVPIWAVDERWKYWRWYREQRHDARTDAKKINGQLSLFD